MNKQEIYKEEIYKEVAQVLRKWAGHRINLDDLVYKYEHDLSWDIFEEIIADLECVFDVDGDEFIELLSKEICPITESSDSLTIRDIIDLIIEKKGPYEAR